MQESDILKQEVREKIIDEIINSSENRTRRFSDLRKHEIYRDQNKKWIVQALATEGYKDTTVFQMQNRASDISICRKITNKLAQAYTGGVTRTVEDTKSQESINALEDELDMNTRMKKSDRYRQLSRNMMVQTVPIKSNRESTPEKDKFNIVPKVLAPWQYDVVEEPQDLTKPMFVILSDFEEQDQLFGTSGEDELKGSQGRIHSTVRSVNHPADRIDQDIADSRADKGFSDKERRFIWWSDHYHMTTDGGGKVIPELSPDELLNPIERLPFVNIAADQDGFFWALGGEDVVESSLLINKILTDINFITFTQGWGQLVISGKDVPKRLEGGPDRAFCFEVKDGDPTPQVYFATSNPPIQDWLETVKAILAMVLSTNDLSPRNISAKLDAANAASGIAMMIEMSESLADIRDVQNLFQDKEPEIWEVIRRWHKLLHETDELVEDLQAIDTFEDSNVKLKFHNIKPVISEKDQLDNIQKRKDLSISTMTELIQIDNPDLSEDEAKAKVKEIMDEKKARQKEMMGSVMKNAMNVEKVEDEDEDEEEENDA